MAQLRQDYDKFVERQTDVIAIGPEDDASFADFWHSHDMPFIGLADHKHVVADLYSQRVSFLTGRMPSMYIIDKAGRIRYIHHGDAMSDIPANEEILSLLDKLNVET
jgi:peroxiredoxin Q/BCP